MNNNYSNVSMSLDEYKLLMKFKNADMMFHEYYETILKSKINLSENQLMFSWLCPEMILIH